jgi:hypothetical protein
VPVEGFEPPTYGLQISASGSSRILRCIRAAQRPDIPGPSIQRLAFLIEIFPPVVGAGHTAPGPLDVIDDRLAHMRQDAQHRHAGDAGAAQIVKLRRLRIIWTHSTICYVMGYVTNATLAYNKL